MYKPGMMNRRTGESGEKMKKRDRILQPEDYREPRCLLGMETYGDGEQVKPVPQKRIMEKLDEYMSRRDYEGAGRHLQYWLEEARLGGDRGGELMIRNELAGYFRKMGERQGAFENADRALRLTEELDMEGTVSAATTYINAATVFSAFGEPEKALPFFEKAREICESRKETDLSFLGGLYNNMGLCCTALGRYAEAETLYQNALEVMERVPGGSLEQAITLLNMADAAAAQYGMEQAEKQINTYLDRAAALFDREDLRRDGYYAFVCEKCVPSFSYYGYFLTAEELEKRAEEIYERT